MRAPKRENKNGEKKTRIKRCMRNARKGKYGQVRWEVQQNEEMKEEEEKDGE